MLILIKKYTFGYIIYFFILKENSLNNKKVKFFYTSNSIFGDFLPYLFHFKIFSFIIKII